MQLLSELKSSRGPTVGDLLDQFLEHAGSMRRSPTTLREYQRLAEKVIRPELGRIKLSKLTVKDLDKLYAKLTARGNQPLTVRHVHALIAAALHQAERWDRAYSHPGHVGSAVVAGVGLSVLAFGAYELLAIGVCFLLRKLSPGVDSA